MRKGKILMNKFNPNGQYLFTEKMKALLSEIKDFNQWKETIYGLRNNTEDTNSLQILV